METFQVRLNCIDHYQATPSEFDPQLPHRDGPASTKTRPKVPVIRVFGATETGQKVCAHIHGAFPYLYIEYDGGLNPNEVDASIRTLHSSIDHALSVSYRRNGYDSNSAFVAHITLVKGVPFYGYHVGHRYFFKIYLLNPMNMTRLADLLRQGAVMRKQLQPYESHMQYLAQWMCDYNLYGCAFIKCSNAKFRGPVPLYTELQNPMHIWHDCSISPGAISDSSVLPKQSHCELEVDIRVQDIINRHEVRERPLHHDFIEKFFPVPGNVKLVPSLAGLWEDESRRRKKKMKLDDAQSSPFTPEDLVSMSADPRNTASGGWIHEDEYRDQVSAIIAEERNNTDEQTPSFEGFVKKFPFEATVKSALDSIEDLYPENLQPRNADVPLPPVQEEEETPVSNVQVDESRIIPPGLEDDAYESDVDFNDSFFNIGPDQPKDPNESDAENGDAGDPDDAIRDFGHDDPLGGPDVVSKSPHVVDKIDSLSELEKLGIRKVGDTIGTEEDEFEIGDEFISEVPPPRSVKRSREFSSSTGEPVKRLKFSNEDNHLRSAGLGFNAPPNHAEIPPTARQSTDKHNYDDGSPPKSSQKPPKSTINPKIPFPVVKDPHDPATIARLSQQNSSFKSQSQSQTPKGATNAASVLPSDDLPLSSSIAPSSDTVKPSMRQRYTQYMYKEFAIPRSRRIFSFAPECPTPSEVRETLTDDFRPSVIYKGPHYSDENDVPERPREYAGREFRLEGDSVPFLPPFDPTGSSPAMFGEKVSANTNQSTIKKVSEALRKTCSLRRWEFAPLPPSHSEVVEWFQKEEAKSKDSKGTTRVQHTQAAPGLSQIDGPTQKNPHRFKYSQKRPSTSVEHETQYMSVMSLEVHVNTRGSLVPDPQEDEIACIFWCVQSEDAELDPDDNSDGVHAGIIALGGSGSMASKLSGTVAAEFYEEPTELDVLTKLIDIVRRHDPDILTGYEVHNGSWGFLIERARHQFDYDLCDELSRVKTQSHGRFGKESDRWGFNHTSTIRVTGRHMINIWRAMRGELNLLQYTMENVVFHVLHQRIPHYSFHDLTAWYRSGSLRNVAKVINYFISRVQLDLKILETNELVSRTSEQARLLGIDFFSVFSRGSQFKVESLMFRIAKPENFILISPSKKQVGQQNALECLPLVMEPQSDFYTSPLLVLDFQSLYPSIMIAYNYCYSTCLGRVANWRGRSKMGIINYNRQPRLLELLEEHINIAPNGIMYTKPEIRKSLLAKMLIEILETRVMVKGGMKADKDDRHLQRLLNNRQLALKLIANVTYGYTSASFSGRMPCAEIADSIVQTARETLEKAIALIHSVERWGAEVVYGDTDSLFIYLKGRSREEAFDIGEEIAKTVTNSNPRPIKLKFEKVYHPCVLLAKKRYVGYKYESRTQKVPEFDAKGIETVRRDGTPAEQKIEEKALRILFETADLSRIKAYFQKQCAKIMQGKVSVQDFCFAKEVRMGTYSENGMPPPGALISAKRMLGDPRLEPQYGERVPYVVISGAPGARLVDRCVAPEVLLQDSQLELDAEYYISKNLIPPLERIFNLVGANVRQWYDEMPKYQRMRRVEGASGLLQGQGASSNCSNAFAKKTLESYMKSSSCAVCREKIDSDHPICTECLRQAPMSLLTVRSKLLRAERKAANLHKICRSCMGVPFGDEVKCDSKDCPVFYSRTRQDSELRSTRAVLEPVARILEDECDNGPLSW